MEITFGKHKGKTVEKLVLTEPNYVSWLLSDQRTSRALKDEIKRLIRLFDAKTLTKKCCNANCGATATRAVVYGESIEPTWWCEKCDPYSHGATKGKLRTVRTYEGAIEHVNVFCTRRKADSKRLIRDLAAAKGLSSRPRAKHIREFFGG